MFYKDCEKKYSNLTQEQLKVKIRELQKEKQLCIVNHCTSEELNEINYHINYVNSKLKTPNNTNYGK